MKINIRHNDDVVIINPSGEILGSDSRQFRDTVAHQLTQVSTAPKFLFDLSGVPMIDSTALGVLMGTQQTVMSERGRLALINIGSQIKTLMSRARVDDLFEQFDSEDQAIAALTTN